MERSERRARQEAESLAANAGGRGVDISGSGDVVGGNGGTARVGVVAGVGPTSGYDAAASLPVTAGVPSGSGQEDFLPKDCKGEMMQFLPAEQVLCNHGDRARCLQCSGRKVVELPMNAFASFSRAFSAVPHFTRPSASELASLAVPSRSLAAGEILFPSFAALVLHVLCPSPTACFLDLGSGTGRAVVAWALIMPKSEAVGVEIRSSLHETACEVSSALATEVKERVHFELGDLFHYDGWKAADVLLINSTGFDDSLMARIEEKLARCTKPAAKAVTLSVPLPSAAGWRLVHQAPYRMTWGRGRSSDVF